MISFAYYGLQLNLGKLAGDVYLNFLIGIVVEILAYFLLFTINRTGRRPMHLAAMFSMTTVCVASIISVMLVDSCKNIFYKMYIKHMPVVVTNSQKQMNSVSEIKGNMIAVSYDPLL